MSRELFYKPLKLNLKELLPTISDSDVDKYHYIIDNLYLRRVIGRRDWTDYLNLSTKLLQKVTSARFACPALKKLVRLEILECDGESKRGVKCLGYRFAEAWRGERFGRVTIKSRKFAKHIEKVANSSIAETIDGRAEYQVVYDTLRRLKVDQQGACASAKLHHSGKKLNARLKAIEAIANADWFFKFDRRKKRLFHNLVQLSRDMRPFVTVDGLKLVHLDFSSLHPAMLAGLYEESSQEKMKYLDWIRKGFYEQFSVEGKTRKELKVALFSEYLFCSTPKKSVVKTRFEDEFPELGKLIYAQKGGEKGKWKDQYSKLSIKLQGREADMVFGIIIPRLLAVHPKMPLLTLHDCIATTEPFAQLVASEMAVVFKEQFGFSIAVNTS